MFCILGVYDCVPQYKGCFALQTAGKLWYTEIKRGESKEYLKFNIIHIKLIFVKKYVLYRQIKLNEINLSQL